MKNIEWHILQQEEFVLIISVPIRDHVIHKIIICNTLSTHLGLSWYYLPKG